MGEAFKVRGKTQTIPLNETVFKRMSLLLEGVLHTYSELTDGKMKFQKFNPFMLTPEKPNSARTTVPVTYNNIYVGEMYAIAFKPQDGTGDNKTYPMGTLKIPGHLVYNEHPEKILPRKKEGIFCEGFFPFFTLLSENSYHKFAASLELLTVDNITAPSTIVKAGDLGLKPTEYYKIVGRSAVSPEIQYTCGYRDNQRFGDPHAVHYGIDTSYIQVVGFLAIKDAQKNLIDEGLCSKWVLPFE